MSFRKHVLIPFIAFVLGTLFILIILETGLRFFGPRNAPKPPVAAKQPGVFRILCLGDSFVFGLGAPPEKSYPRQLEEILNGKGLPKRVEVVTYGYPAGNTSELCAIFARDIDTQKPDLLIFTGGKVNGSSFSGYHTYRRSKDFFSRLLDQARRTRLWQLVSPRTADAKARKGNTDRGSHNYTIKPDNPAAEQDYLLACQEQSRNNLQGAIALADKALAADPSYPLPYRLLGEIYESEGMTPEAIDSYEKYLKKAPDPDKAQRLGSLYFEAGKYEEAFNAYTRGMEMNDHLISFIHCFPGLQRLAQDDRTRLREKVIAYLKHIRPEMDDDGKAIIDDIIADRFGAKEIDAWRAHDITKIIDGCRERRIPVILMDYPEETSVIKEITAARGLPYIDNRATFDTLLSTGPRSNYFSIEELCNAEGYRVLAENAANKILELGLIR